MSLRNDVSDEFVTVIDKCTTTCSRVQNITGTAAATFSANSTHFFSCFKEVVSDGSGLIVSGVSNRQIRSYICILTHVYPRLTNV